MAACIEAAVWHLMCTQAMRVTASTTAHRPACRTACGGRCCTAAAPWLQGRMGGRRVVWVRPACAQLGCSAGQKPCTLHMPPLTPPVACPAGGLQAQDNKLCRPAHQGQSGRAALRSATPPQSAPRSTHLCPSRRRSPGRYTAAADVGSRVGSMSGAHQWQASVDGRPLLEYTSCMLFSTRRAAVRPAGAEQQVWQDSKGSRHLPSSWRAWSPQWTALRRETAQQRLHKQTWSRAQRPTQPIDPPSSWRARSPRWASRGRDGGRTAGPHSPAPAA